MSYIFIRKALGTFLNCIFMHFEADLYLSGSTFTDLNITVKKIMDQRRLSMYLTKRLLISLVVAKCSCTLGQRVEEYLPDSTLTDPVCVVKTLLHSRPMTHSSVDIAWLLC